jgi:hypothetical protein
MHCREPTNGAAVIAERLEQLAAGRGPPQPAAPLSRLRDTIVFGYLMQTPKHTRVEVPEWYINGLEPSRRLVRLVGFRVKLWALCLVYRWPAAGLRGVFSCVCWG